MRSIPALTLQIKAFIYGSQGDDKIHKSQITNTISREKITHDNFPHATITSPEDLCERLSRFNNIALDNESVLLFKNQFDDYRLSVNKTILAAAAAASAAAPGSKKECCIHAVTSSLLDISSFTHDMLMAIKQLREFSRFNAAPLLFGDVISAEGKPVKPSRIDVERYQSETLSCDEFQSIGKSVAAGLAKQMLIVLVTDTEHSILSLTRVFNADDKHKHRNYKEFEENFSRIHDWIEGKTDNLPAVLSLEANSIEANRIFNVKY